MVNSGNSRSEVQNYLERVSVGLPTIVDPGRRFEQRFDVGTISLRNIRQYRVVRPDGSRSPLSFRSPAGDLSRTMGSPSWFVEPDQVEKKLRPLWRAVEFGNFRKAAGMFKQAEGLSGNMNKTVQKLKDVVNRVVDQEIEEAQSLEESGETWSAFQKYKQIAFHARGFNAFQKAKSAARKLKEDAQVKNEMRAQRILQKIRKALSSPETPAQRKQAARKALEKLIQQFPGTKAAHKAKSIR